MYLSGVRGFRLFCPLTFSSQTQRNSFSKQFHSLTEMIFSYCFELKTAEENVFLIWMCPDSYVWPPLFGNREPLALCA